MNEKTSETIIERAHRMIIQHRSREDALAPGWTQQAEIFRKIADLLLKATTTGGVIMVEQNVPCEEKAANSSDTNPVPLTQVIHATFVRIDTGPFFLELRTARNDERDTYPKGAILGCLDDGLKAEHALWSLEEAMESTEKVASWFLDRLGQFTVGPVTYQPSDSWNCLG